MSYVNKRPYCSFEHVFIGSLVVELVLLFAFFFPHQVRTKVSFSAALGTQWNRAVCGRGCHLETHNDNVSEVLMLMGRLLVSKSRSTVKSLPQSRLQGNVKQKHLQGQLRITR